MPAADGGDASAAAPATPGRPGRGRGRPRWGRIAAALAALARSPWSPSSSLGGGRGRRRGQRIRRAPKVAGDPIAVDGMPVGIAAGDGTVAVATRVGQRVALIDEKTGKPTGDAVPLPAPTARTSRSRPGRSGRPSRARTRSSRRRARRREPEHDRRRCGGRSGSRADDGARSGPPSRTSGQRRLDRHRRQVGQHPIPIDRPRRTRPRWLPATATLWVVDREGGQIFRIDPNDPSTAAGLRASAPTRRASSSPTTDSVWVANTDDGNRRPARHRRRPAGADRRRRRAAAAWPTASAASGSPTATAPSRRSIPHDNSVQRVETFPARPRASRRHRPGLGHDRGRATRSSASTPAPRTSGLSRACSPRTCRNRLWEPVPAISAIGDRPAAREKG